MHFNIGGEGEDTYLVRRGSCDWQGPLSLPPQENAPVVHTVCVHVCVHVWRLLSYKSAIHLSPAQRWKTKSSQSPLVQLTHKQPHTEVKDRLETIITQLPIFTHQHTNYTYKRSYTVTWGYCARNTLQWSGHTWLLFAWLPPHELLWYTQYKVIIQL